jgi:hypothetical protein
MMIIVIISWDAQTQPVSLQVKRYSFILDVLVSYLGRDTLPDWGIHFLLQSLQESARIELGLDKDRFFESLFPTITIRPSRKHPMPRNLDAKSIVKYPDEKKNTRFPR